MSDKTPNQLLDHNCDGIQEYDNPMPRWWVWIFWATIVFSAVYFVWFHMGPGKGIHDEYNEEMATWDAQLAANATPLLGEAELAAIFADPDRVAAGKAVFASKCFPCHALDGGGMVGLGPNLTDDYWKSGDGSLSAIYKVVREGVANTAMVAWDQQLKPVELTDVVAHVKTLHGTTPAVPKEPEGQLVGAAPDSAAVAADSGAVETAQGK